MPVLVYCFSELAEFQQHSETWNCRTTQGDVCRPHAIITKANTTFTDKLTVYVLHRHHVHVFIGFMTAVR